MKLSFNMQTELTITLYCDSQYGDTTILLDVV